jgi:allantoinase
VSDRLLLRGRRVALPAGVASASVAITDGVITGIGAYDAPAQGARELDAGAAIVLPGLVDSHVHANEPGRTDWEGLGPASQAAAAGGVTTIVDMPLNSLPPTLDVAALELKRDAARGRVWIDVAFWGGAVPANIDELPALAAAGVCGVKGFLAESGVPEFPWLDEISLARAMDACARHGITLLVHAELPPGAVAAEVAIGRSYASWLASRPARSEVDAISLLIRHQTRLAARGPAPRVHVVHLSAADALPVVAGARAAGLPLSAETCPHYLALTAESIADGATLCKCAPPIRGAENRERLWHGLAEGILSLVASDHSPSPPAGKALDDGDFGRAWGGISSLGLGLPVVWTEAVRRGFDAADVARWMALEPARLAGLDTAKGALAPGRDADFVLFDPDAAWTVVPERLWTRHKITPYAGRTLRGRVLATHLRGERVFAAGEPGEAGTFEGAPRGRLQAPTRGD